MKKNSTLYFSIIIISILLITVLSGCNNKSAQLSKTSEPEEKTEFLIGTICTIKIYDNPSETAFKAAFDKVKDIEKKMSINLSDSEIISLNKEAGEKPVKLSAETFLVIKKGLEYSTLSNGKFDITIGPLVKLWGIGTPSAKVPSEEELEKNKKLVNYKNLELNDEKTEAFLKEKGMIVDLGAIAKGYAADEVAKILRENNVNHAVINMGGNVYVLGDKIDNSPWKVGIQDPFSPRGDTVGYIEAANKSIVTSGIYERYFEEDGIKYHHILDSITGYPTENNIAGVSIISDASIDGDALSTTIFSLGLEEGTKLIESLNGVEAIFVTKDKKIFVTSGMKDNFQLTDENFSYN